MTMTQNLLLAVGLTSMAIGFCGYYLVRRLVLAWRFFLIRRKAREAMKFLLLAIILAATPTLAHDMSDPDAEWYRGLTVPGTNLPCCSGPGMSEDVDCRNVEVRQARDADGSVYWEAFADSKLFPESKKSPNYGFAPDAWVRVPEEAIVRGKTNPTARPVGCWYAKAWRCFVEGAGT